jgi:hypothetical protein
MSVTRFLSNDALWFELGTRTKRTTSVKAAVAFLGRGGADLLPLKKGDTLVVNLGIRTVKQGLTAPKEIQRLIRRGVKVFTRSTLHAKFFLCDRWLLVGSANVSRTSRFLLDEAASLTTDSVAIRRAADFFHMLCTEPVRPEYLKICLDAYRPPSFPPNDVFQSARRRRVVEAKLWFISGLRYYDVPAIEKKSAEELQRQAAKKLQKKQGTSVDFNHYPTRPGYFSQIRVGDWIVNCISDNNAIRFVHAPQQVLGQESYTRAHGRKRYLLLSEAPDSGETIALTQFRRSIRRVAPELDRERARTTPIQSAEIADAILSLWTPTGRVAKRRKARRSKGV